MRENGEEVWILKFQFRKNWSVSNLDFLTSSMKVNTVSIRITLVEPWRQNRKLHFFVKSKRLLEMIRCKYVLAMHDNNCAYWLICHPNQDEIWWWATTNFLYYLAFRHRSWSISECIQIHHWSGGVEMTLKVHHQNQYMSKYSYICSIDSILGIIFDEISTSSSTYIR